MNSVETRMMEAIDRNRKKIHKTGRKIWEFREVGWEEFNSSALLMDELEKEGFEVQRGLVGKHPKFDHKIDMPTAFKAVFKGKEGGPVIGIMLEYDALPNGHACGHNLIASAGFAAALGLKEVFQTTGRLLCLEPPQKNWKAPNIIFWKADIWMKWILCLPATMVRTGVRRLPERPSYGRLMITG